jgi:hypothetical protein
MTFAGGLVAKKPRTSRRIGVPKWRIDLNKINEVLLTRR